MSREQQPGQDLSEHVQTLSAEWKSMKPEEKQKFVKLSEKDSERYRAEMERFLKEHADWEAKVATRNAIKRRREEMVRFKPCASYIHDLSLNDGEGTHADGATLPIFAREGQIRMDDTAVVLICRKFAQYDVNFLNDFSWETVLGYFISRELPKWSRFKEAVNKYKTAQREKLLEDDDDDDDDDEDDEDEDDIDDDDDDDDDGDEDDEEDDVDDDGKKDHQKSKVKNGMDEADDDEDADDEDDEDSSDDENDAAAWYDVPWKAKTRESVRFLEAKRALATNISPHELALTLMKGIYSHPLSGPFQLPVGRHVKDYYRRVKNPIDLGQIVQRVRSGFYSDHRGSQRHAGERHDKIVAQL